MNQQLKYALALFPAASWLLAVLVSPVIPSMYDFSTPFRVFGPLLLLLVLAGAVVSLPVVFLAVRRLLQGKELRWVAVSLVFSLPIFLLSAIAMLGMFVRA
jgi:hypothetical protein